MYLAGSLYFGVEKATCISNGMANWRSFKEPCYVCFLSVASAAVSFCCLMHGKTYRLRSPLAVASFCFVVSSSLRVQPRSLRAQASSQSTPCPVGLLFQSHLIHKKKQQFSSIANAFALLNNQRGRYFNCRN